VGGQPDRATPNGVTRPSAPIALCAPNAFKGTLTAAGAAHALAAGVVDGGWRARSVPVADGGDGTLDVLLAGASVEARVQELRVTGPLGRPRRARLGWLGRDLAVVEMAEAAGLRLLRPARKGEPEWPGTRFFKPLRQVIESVNDTFKGQLDLERHGGHTPAGVLVRVLPSPGIATVAGRTKPPRTRGRRGIVLAERCAGGL